jgi:hypothetical protein
MGTDEFASIYFGEKTDEQFNNIHMQIKDHEG